MQRRRPGERINSPGTGPQHSLGTIPEECIFARVGDGSLAVLLQQRQGDLIESAMAGAVNFIGDALQGRIVFCGSAQQRCGAAYYHRYVSHFMTNLPGGYVLIQPGNQVMLPALHSKRLDLIQHDMQRKWLLENRHAGTVGESNAVWVVQPAGHGQQPALWEFQQYILAKLNAKFIGKAHIDDQNVWTRSANLFERFLGTHSNAEIAIMQRCLQ